MDGVQKQPGSTTTDRPRLNVSPKHIVAYLVCAITLTAVIYWPGLQGPWLLDDLANIGPTFTTQLDTSRIYELLTTNKGGPLGRPLSYLSFGITSYLHGDSPWGFKFHNLLIHCFSGVVVFILLYRLLCVANTERQSQALSLQRGYLIVCLATALWLLHPIQVSTVLYSVQRMAQLSALFSLLALLCYVVGRQKLSKAPRIALGYLFIGVPFFSLTALFSKETGGLILLYILVLEFGFFHSVGLVSRAPTAFRLFLVGCVILPLVLGGLGIAAKHNTIINFATRDYTMLQRIYSESVILTDYLQMIFLPQLSQFSVFHDGLEPKRVVDSAVIASALLHLATIVLALLWRYRFPLISVGILWYYAGHVLESTIFPLELKFDHRNYLPVLGPLLILCYGVSALRKRLFFGIAGLLVTYCLGLSALQVNTWSDERMLLQSSVAENPQSDRARMSYIMYLTKQGEFSNASIQLEKAILQKPTKIGYRLMQLSFICRFTGDIANLPKSEARMSTLRQLASQQRVEQFAVRAVEYLTDTLSQQPCQGFSIDDHRQLVLAITAQQRVVASQNKLVISSLLQLSARLAYLLGDEQQALLELEASYRLLPQNSVLINRIEILLSLQQLNEAGQLLQHLANNAAPKDQTRLAQLQSQLKSQLQSQSQVLTPLQTTP